MKGCEAGIELNTISCSDLILSLSDELNLRDIKVDA